MYKVSVFTFGDFAENTYILYHPSGDCIIIDPGCFRKSETQQLDDFISKNNLTPKLLLNTHCHIDHILGNDHVIQKYNLSLHLHEGELFTYRNANKWAAMLGVPSIEIPDRLTYIEAGNTFQLADETLEVLFVPGHSIAHCCFLDRKNNILISGDTLFYESIGRTDLPGGNHVQLLQSIRNELFVLADEVKVYPGHGPATSIGHEKTHNPFLL